MTAPGSFDPDEFVNSLLGSPGATPTAPRPALTKQTYEALEVGGGSYRPYDRLIALSQGERSGGKIDQMLKEAARLRDAGFTDVYKEFDLLKSYEQSQKWGTAFVVGVGKALQPLAAPQQVGFGVIGGLTDLAQGENPGVKLKRGFGAALGFLTYGAVNGADRANAISGKDLVKDWGMTGVAANVTGGLLDFFGDPLLVGGVLNVAGKAARAGRLGSALTPSPAVAAMADTEALLGGAARANKPLASAFQTITSMTEVVNNVSTGAIKNPAAFRRAAGEIVRNPFRTTFSLPGVVDDTAMVGGNPWSVLRENIDLVSGIQSLASTANAVARIGISPAPIKQAWQAIPLSARISLGEAVGTTVERMRFRPLGFSAAGADTMSIGEQLFSRWGTIAGIPETNIQKLIETGRSSGTGISRKLQQSFRLRQIEAANIGMRAIDLQGRYAKITSRLDDADKRYFDYLSTKVLDAKDPAALMSSYHDFERATERFGIAQESGDFLRRVADYDVYGATVRNRIGIEDNYGLTQYQEGLDLLTMIVSGDRAGATKKVNDWLEYSVNPQFSNVMVQGYRQTVDASGKATGTTPIYNPVVGRNSPATFTGQANTRKLWKPGNNLASVQGPGAPLAAAQVTPVWNESRVQPYIAADYKAQIMDFPADMQRVYDDPARFQSGIPVSSTKVGDVAVKPDDPTAQIPVVGEAELGMAVAENFPETFKGYRSLIDDPKDIRRLQAALYTDGELLSKQGDEIPYDIPYLRDNEYVPPSIVVGRDGKLYVQADDVIGRVVERKGQLYLHGLNPNAKSKALALEGDNPVFREEARAAPEGYEDVMNAGSGENMLAFGAYRNKPNEIMEGMQVGAFDESLDAANQTKSFLGTRTNTALPKETVEESFALGFERQSNDIFESKHVADIKRIWPDEVTTANIPHEVLPPKYNYENKLMFQRGDVSTPGVHLTDNPAVAIGNSQKPIFAVRLNAQKVFDESTATKAEREILDNKLKKETSADRNEAWYTVLRNRGYTAIRRTEDYNGVPHNTLTLLPGEQTLPVGSFSPAGDRISGGPGETASFSNPDFSASAYRKAYNTPEDEYPAFVDETAKGQYGRQVSETDNPFSQLPRDPNAWNREEAAGAQLHLRRMFLASENPELVIQRIDRAAPPRVTFDTPRLEKVMLEALVRNNRTDTTAAELTRRFQQAWSDPAVAPVDHITGFFQGEGWGKGEIRDFLNSVGKEFWPRGGIDWKPPGELLAEQMHRYLASSSGGFGGAGSGARINATSRAPEKSRQDLAPHWQEALNDIQDLGEVITAQSRVNEKLISRRGMVNDMYVFLQNEGGIITPEEIGPRLRHNRQGWRTITKELESSLKGVKDAEVKGMGIKDTPFKEGMMIPAAYYNALAQMVTTAKPSTTGAVIQWLNAKWKQHKIASPGAIVRDSAGNFALASMAGIRPDQLAHHYGMYARLMRESRRLGGGTVDLVDDTASIVLKNGEKVTIKEIMEAGDFMHSGFFFREVAEPLDNLAKELINPVSDNIFQRTAAALQRFSESTTGTRANPAVRAGAQSVRVGVDVMGFGGPITKWLGDKKGMVDAGFKGAVYLAKRGEGMKPAQAAQYADDLFFNYENVPYVVDTLRRSGISPFAAFQFLSAGRFIKTLYENPYAMQRMYRIPGSIREANEETYDKERRSSPSYIRNAMWIPVVAPDGTWIRDSKGDSQWLNLGAFLPETATGDMFLQGPGGTFSSVASPTFEFFSGLISGRGYKGMSIYEGGGNFEQTLAQGELGTRAWAMGVAKEFWRFGATPWAPGSSMMERIGRSMEQAVVSSDMVKHPDARDMMSIASRISGYDLVAHESLRGQPTRNLGNALQEGPVIAAVKAVVPGPDFDALPSRKGQAAPPDLFPALLRAMGITVENSNADKSRPGSQRNTLIGYKVEADNLQKSLRRAISSAEEKDRPAIRAYYQKELRKLQLKFQVQTQDE